MKKSITFVHRSRWLPEPATTLHNRSDAPHAAANTPAAGGGRGGEAARAARAVAGDSAVAGSRASRAAFACR